MARRSRSSTRTRVIAVVVGALLLHGLSAIASSAPTGYPVPPRGAVVFGAEAGRLALGLAVTPGHAAIGLQASVVGMQGPVDGLAVRFDVRGGSGESAASAGTACGAGCYRASVGVRRPLRVVVRVGGERPVSFAMPAVWPPLPAAGIVERAGAAWRKLRTLAFHETLGDGHTVLHAHYKEVRPDRLEYSIAGNLGSEIIVGDRRWVRTRGSTHWLESPQAPIHQPLPSWRSATDAYVLGTVTREGRPAWKVSFFDRPGGPAWITILVDEASFRTKELWMTAQVHFLHKIYDAFDAPIEIRPPS